MGRGRASFAAALGKAIFLAVNQYFARGFDADPDLIAVNLDDSDNDIVTNDDLLAQLPAKNQHGHLPVDIEDWNSHSPFATKRCAHIISRISCATLCRANIFVVGRRFSTIF